MSETALPKILKTLGFNDSDANRAAFDVGGVVPSEVATATQLKTYVCYGNADQEFSFTDLEIEFQKHCKDYSSAINNEASRAVEFAVKILFEAGPQIRTEKKSKGNKVVKFVFPYKRDETILSIHTVYVVTFKDTKFIGSSTDNTMVLTFKQAGLLATKVLNKVAEYVYNQERLVMTPLCRAIYSKEEVPKLASVLKMQPVEVVKMLNSSCCSGGQHLDESNIACAIAAALSATRKVADKNIRDSIVSKVVKQYSKKKKIYNETEFQTFCMYALGGVPAGLDTATLIEKFDNIQTRETTIRSPQKAVNESRIQSISTKVRDTSTSSVDEQSIRQGAKKKTTAKAALMPGTSKSPTRQLARTSTTCRRGGVLEGLINMKSEIIQNHQNT